MILVFQFCINNILSKQYGAATTIHGIQYILEPKRFSFERILWVVLVGIGTGVAILFSAQIYSDWKKDPILTTIGTTGFDIQKMEYPSITICAQGAVNEIIGKRWTRES